MRQSINLIIENALQELKAAGVESSGYEIRLLLGEVLGVEVSALMFGEVEMSGTQKHRFCEFLERRKRHMPADKILGRRGFYKYDFKVSEDVLTPRPDTEILVEAAIEKIKQQGKEEGKILELGVGSGCIICSVLAEFKGFNGVGIDISAKALDVATKNAKELGVDGRVDFCLGDWFAKDFLSLLGAGYDVLLSNPPYIKSEEINTLDEEVKKYDPLKALDGGLDGLDSYRRIAKLAPSLVKKSGYILLEVGEGQARDVAQIFNKEGFVTEEIKKDLSSTERCVILKK